MLITRPTLEDVPTIMELFTETISDNFREEGIIDNHQSELVAEIISQWETLQQDFHTNGQENYFLIAKKEGKIVGTIAYGTPNTIIQQHLEGVAQLAIPEIKSVYILPKFQKQGIGSTLLKAILQILNDRQISAFCLDCGYRKSQSFWKKKLGEPTKILSDYWDINAHHMIWQRDTINSLSMI